MRIARGTTGNTPVVRPDTSSLLATLLTITLPLAGLLPVRRRTRVM